MIADQFLAPERAAVHRVIRARRDIRQFKSKPVPTKIVARILEAAHAAPSVGLMQPWNFILIESTAIRRKIKRNFEVVNSKEKLKLKGTMRGKLYDSLKLEGILESPLNIAVTCDPSRSGPFVLGRAPMPQTSFFSVCLAIENLWLAARAEGIGVGWVSVLDRAAVERILGLPAGIELVAYLCVGYPVEFRANPMLEEVGWKKRENLRTLVFHNRWGVSRRRRGQAEKTTKTQSSFALQPAPLRRDGSISNF